MSDAQQIFFLTQEGERIRDFNIVALVRGRTVHLEESQRDALLRVAHILAGRRYLPPLHYPHIHDLIDHTHEHIFGTRKADIPIPDRISFLAFLAQQGVVLGDPARPKQHALFDNVAVLPFLKKAVR